MNPLADTEIINRHLAHGAIWPRGHARAGEPTPVLEPTGIVVHAMLEQIAITDAVLEHYPADDYPRVHARAGERVWAATWLDLVGLSAHALVSPDGPIIRCRWDHEIAWHASGFNDTRLGVEVLVRGAYDYGAFLTRIDEPWIEPGSAQFAAAAAQVTDWCLRHGIRAAPGTIDRHSDLDPNRKRDPGAGFPWARLLESVEQALETAGGNHADDR